MHDRYLTYEKQQVLRAYHKEIGPYPDTEEPGPLRHLTKCVIVDQIRDIETQTYGYEFALLTTGDTGTHQVTIPPSRNDDTIWVFSDGAKSAAFEMWPDTTDNE
jgi:hypothetical protein